MINSLRYHFIVVEIEPMRGFIFNSNDFKHKIYLSIIIIIVNYGKIGIVRPTKGWLDRMENDTK